MAAPVFQLHPDAGTPTTEEPNHTEILPGPSAPLDVARVLAEDFTEDGHLLLRKWRGEFMRYIGPHWVETDHESLRKVLYERLESAAYLAKNKDGDLEQKPWSPDKGKLDKLMDALIAPCLLDRDTDAPSWISTGESAAGLVPCLNGLVDVQTQEVLPCTPDYFGTTAIPVEYDPNAPCAVEWLKFLRTVWPAGPDGQDAAEIRVLAQWFGYVLSGRLDLQKMLMLVGPPRSGKGTIARMLTALVGKGNTSAPTLAGMATNFGLESTIGKTLSVIGDARLSNQGQEAVIERMLSITGQDRITLDRKNRAAWEGTLQTRLMLLSNDLPKFLDSSGAIASRFVILRFEESFLGKEDTQLERKLLAELPAILKWALEGLVDLNATGRFTEPATHIEAMTEMYDLVSPITAFIRDVCDVDPNTTVPFADLYREYEAWCRENTRGITNTARFSADLKSRMPGLKTDYRPRTEDGRKMPRHVRGLSVSTEWAERVKPHTIWRGGTE